MLALRLAGARHPARVTGNIHPVRMMRLPGRIRMLWERAGGRQRPERAWSG
jgi:hypothetical protein